MAAHRTLTTLAIMMPSASKCFQSKLSIMFNAIKKNKTLLFQEERQQLLGGGGRRPRPRPRQRVVDTFQGNTTLNLSSKQIWVRSSTRPRPWKRPEETSKTMKKRQEETLKTIKRQERTSKTMKKNSKRPWKKTGRDFKHPIFQLSRPRSVFVTQTGATTRIQSLRWDVQR